MKLLSFVAASFCTAFLSHPVHSLHTLRYEEALLREREILLENDHPFIVKAVLRRNPLNLKTPRDFLKLESKDLPKRTGQKRIFNRVLTI
eukprot:4339694-Amphidinium_carterae.1